MKEIAAILIEHEADINVEDMKGWTPLHRVAAAGCMPSHLIPKMHNPAQPVSTG